MASEYLELKNFDMIERIQQHLQRHGYTGFADISETQNGEIHINVEWGDWKHDHAYLDYLCQLMGLIPVHEAVTEENGSDCYSAIHIYCQRTFYNAISLGEYDGELKQLAKGLKAGDEEAIRIAAFKMAPLMPKNGVLIPMPSHDGQENFTTKLCKLLSEITSLPMCDALTCEPHESLCEPKKRAVADGSPLPYPEVLMMKRKVYSLPEGIPVIIDNVIASGTTAVAALNALRNVNGMVWAVADDKECKKVVNFKKKWQKNIN